MLRDYQTASIDGVYDQILQGNRAPLIAMPTGTGKSLALAGLVHRTCSEYPQTRHIVLSHVKEILEQDYDAIKLLWPTAPVGVYSASLRRRDTMQPIIIGGCASVINCVEKFGHRDFVIIDEAHLLSPESETTYQKIISKLREINPKLIVVGLTATPYRRGIGTLLNNGVFDSMAIDLTDKKSWARFIAENYLVPLHAKKTEAQIDVRGVKIINGDYSEKDLQAASDKDELNQAIAKEIWAAAETRKATLVFCAGIEHAEHMAEELRIVGMRAEAIHSKMDRAKRDLYLEMFKRGELDALTNNNCLTTGVNVPRIDLIAMCRATVSVNLWVQMLGRGSRPAPDKNNCLVLDFAGNRPRLGPVDDPYIPKPKGESDKSGEIPVKVCGNCGCYAHISARVCENCGTKFDIKTKLTNKAGEVDIMSTSLPIIKKFPVLRLTCARHLRRADGTAIVRVTYMCGGGYFNTWLNFEAPRQKHFAHEWWRQHVGDDIPQTNDEALALLSGGCAVTPAKVNVWTNKGKYPEIIGYEF